MPSNTTDPAALRWDLFCRVIDNLGDVGVAWRLAAALGRRGQAVRLWIDEPAALAWLAPQGAPGVVVRDWAEAGRGDTLPGDVVVETFGCALPEAFVAAMARAAPPPLWINVEYLSAEDYVERSHGLASPHFSGPGAGLRSWFFYPGFSAGTGGVLQEMPAAQTSRHWLQAQGWGTAEGERGVTLFCYHNPALPELLACLSAQGPVLLRVPPGPAQAQLRTLALPPGQRWLALPHLAQTDFDRLLAGADLNIVRGEDSFVRAQLCPQVPLLWQIYPQQDGAHATKLQAFLARHTAASPPALAAAVQASHRAFNGLGPMPPALPERAGWVALQGRWCAQLCRQADLCSQFLGFARSRLGEAR
jgi:uncharacterized repeat protein (TIGR03837 family)